MKRIRKTFILMICFILLSGFNIDFNQILKKEINKKEETTQKEVSFDSNVSKGGYVLPDDITSFAKKLYSNPLKKGPIQFGNPIIPSTYDLRDVNGNNYAPEVRNQGALELCWAFAMNSALESYALKHNLGRYNFSENQLDLALVGLTSYNQFVKDAFEDPDAGYFVNHELGKGSNYLQAMYAWIFGMGPTTEESFGYDYFDTLSTYNSIIPQKTKYMDASYSDFQINDVNFYSIYLDYGSYGVSDFKTIFADSIKELYLDPVKNQIMENGAVATAMMAPPSMGYDSNVFFYTPYDINNKNEAQELIDDGYGGHAVTIIGWNDNYGDIDEDGIGDGAWLVQNSWGNELTYFYLSYYDPSAASSMLGVSSASTKDYNLQYNQFTEFSSESTLSGTRLDVHYLIGEEEEKLEAVKLYSVDMDVTPINISLSVESSSGVCTSNESGSEFYSGIKTFTFDNCMVSGDAVVTATGVDIDEFVEIVINTTSSVTEETLNYYEFSNNNPKGGYFNNIVGSGIAYGIYTKNIESYSDLGYVVMDEEGNDISSHFSIKKYTEFLNGASIVQFVLENKIDTDNTNITFKLKYQKDGQIKYIDLKEFLLYVLEGDGTQENPYLLKYPEDLIVTNNSSSYFKLNNDLDFEVITNSEFGKFYNEGKGWQGTLFKGVLDGDGYSIKNFYSSYSGLFIITNGATIKNLKIDNANIVGGTSSLIKEAYKTTIDNVEVVNSKFISNGSTTCASPIVAVLSQPSSLTNIKIKDSVVTGNNLVSGLVCTISNSKNDSGNTLISDNYIENTIISTSDSYDNYGETGRIPYIANAIYLYNYSIDDDPIKLTITNNKYLQKNDDTEDVINANGVYGSLYLSSKLIGDITDMALDFSTNNIINTEESKVQTNFPSFDFTNKWAIEDNETPRLKLFDIPEEEVAPSVEIGSYVLHEEKYIKGLPEDVSILEIDEDLEKGTIETTKQYFGLDGTPIRDSSIPLVTGMQLIIDNGHISKKYTLIINGDIDSNGGVDVLDFRRIANYISGNAEEQAEIFKIDAQMEAANVNNDELIDILDFRKIGNYLADGSF